MSKLRLEVTEKLSQGGTVFSVLQSLGVRIQRQWEGTWGTWGWSLSRDLLINATGSESAEEGLCGVLSGLGVGRPGCKACSVINLTCRLEQVLLLLWASVFPGAT